MSKNASPSDLKLFQVLQQVQWELWLELQPAVPDDPYDVSERFERERSYREHLQEREKIIAAEFDVPHEHLREVMLRGVREGWPLGEA